jgi:HK97 family phage major capsid protein
LGSDETHPDDEGSPAGEDESAERPYGARPYGARPYGARPYGARPYGARPYGARPYGARPYGARPYGARPYGARPYGARPYGARPYGARPYGARPYGARPYGARLSFDDDWEGGALDPEVWSADVSELILERSAVIRLGAMIVIDEYELPVPAFDATANAPDYIKEGKKKPRLEPKDEAKLRPKDHELAAKLVLPNRLVRDIEQNPAIADALKEDLAEALALRADRAFLHGDPPPPPPRVDPTGISNRVPLDPGLPVAGNLLATARNMVGAVRAVDPLVNPVFRAAGWVLHPTTLEALTRLMTPDGLGVGAGRTLDTYGGLLRLDGSDGGRLLGFPFVVSAGAFDGAATRMYFSADWREAWIGLDRELVTVDVSTDAHFQTDETAIRATMLHDFTLRRPEAFTWADV